MARPATTLERARQSFRERAWETARAQLTAADRENPIHADDLERLAIAAYLTGRDEESVEAWTRAHQDWLHVQDEQRAVRCAFWLGSTLMERGEMARGGGWLARARRVLDDVSQECAEEGYLLVSEGIQGAIAGDLPAGLAAFRRAAEIGERFHDLGLVTLARHGEGRALVQLGETARGAELLDEVMVAVTSGEVSSLVTGIVYCSVIEACRQMFDLRRAQEWTAALDRWSGSQPDLVAFRGQCLIYRAEIMGLRGEWAAATDEAGRAVDRLSRPRDQPALGLAHYQGAELHRLRGEFAAAERGYRAATEHGRTPQPGLGLLRLAQGQVDAAAAAIRGVLDEPMERNERAAMLTAYVEVMLASGDVAAARAGVHELETIAAAISAPLLQALASRAKGTVELAEGDTRSALANLRRALAAWQVLDAPYEVARTRVLIGRACRALGDDDTAELELRAAITAFDELGAVTDLREAEVATGARPEAREGVLTGRELEVLRLLASGRTNRAIAADLVISEKTVARHVSNIFAKLGLSSRAAATAYAYEHRLV